MKQGRCPSAGIEENRSLAAMHAEALRLQGKIPKRGKRVTGPGSA